MPPFEELIQETGKLLGIAMTTDKRNACKLKFEKLAVTLQIDLSPDGERFLVVSEVGEAPPEGHLRERFFRACLKFNGVHQERGIFAYSERKEVLVSFRFFYVNAMTAEKLSSFLKTFVADVRNVFRENNFEL